MKHRATGSSTHCWITVLLVPWLVAGTSSGADRIVLRSLKIISDRTVVGWDDEGVQLDDQKVLPWYEIEKGTIAGGRQAEFDRQVAELAEPLFRIRQRLTTADYAGALPLAESLGERLAQGSGDTAYLVQQTLMWGRLDVGRREEALDPYLRCFHLLRTRPAASQSLPGTRRLRWHPETGLTDELPAIWWDAAAAQRVLPVVYRRIAELPRPRPEGISLYYVAMALAAGDEAAAERVLAAVQPRQPALQELKQILEAQREIVAHRAGPAVETLAAQAATMSAANRPFADYWLGRVRLESPERTVREAGLVRLLRVPALAGRQQQELAAAALFHVQEALQADGNAVGSESVRRELLERYGQTYYALRVRGSQENGTKP